MTKTLTTLIKIADKKLEDQQKNIADVNAAIMGAKAHAVTLPCTEKNFLDFFKT